MSSDSETSMTFTVLPAEILGDISEFVAESSRKQYKRWAEGGPDSAGLSCDYANEDGILALTLVNRLLRDVTLPIVFRKVGLYLGWLEAFENPEELMVNIIHRAIRAMEARPERIKFVKHFELYGYDYPDEGHMDLFSDFLIRVLSFYETLEVLSVNLWALNLPGTKLLDAIVRHETLVRMELTYAQYYEFRAPKIDSYEKFVCNSVDIISSRPREGLVQHLSRGLSVSYLSVDSHESATWQTHSYRGLSQLHVKVEGTGQPMLTNL